MAKYWFKAKRYGYGIGFPVTWQGWVAMICLVVVSLIAAYTDNIICFFPGNGIPGLKDNLRFLLDLLIIVFLFLLIFQEKIEGGLKWHWGENKGQ